MLCLNKNYIENLLTNAILYLSKPIMYIINLKKLCKVIYCYYIYKILKKL